MKFAKLIYLLGLAVTLSLGMAGCKKGSGKLTPLPGRGAGQVGDSGPSKAAFPDSAPPIRLDNGNPTGTGTGLNTGNTPPVSTEVGAGLAGLPTTEKDLGNYTPDREKFRDQTIYFEYDKYNIKPGEISKLETVANEMKNLSGKGLRIEGHCDERGTREYNIALGDRRATAVRQLLKLQGVADKQIATISFGEERPVALGHDEDSWWQNRRAVCAYR